MRRHLRHGVGIFAWNGVPCTSGVTIVAKLARLASVGLPVARRPGVRRPVTRRLRTRSGAVLFPFCNFRRFEWHCKRDPCCSLQHS